MDVVLHGNASEASVPSHKSKSSMCAYTIVGKKVTFFSCTLVAVDRGTFLPPKSVPLHTRWMRSYMAPRSKMRVKVDKKYLAV